MRFKLGLVSVGVAAAVAVATAAPATAGGYDGDYGPKAKVIANGLDNPRGLTIRHGTLYIAQAGKGGDGSDNRCITNPEDPTSRNCLGATGKISSLKLGTTQGVKDLVTGLPSLADPAAGGSAAIGPSDVALDGLSQVWATIGLGADPAERTTSLGGGLANVLGTEGKVKNGQFIVRGDVSGFEASANPDGVEPPDSNPNSLVTTGGGSVMVADAGGNSLVNVHSTGVAQAVATFPTKPAVQVPGAPDGVTIEAQAVPDAVTRGADGTFYIGELTGFPFTPGAAQVWSWRPGHTPKVFATGFTNIIDLAVTPSGDLLVLEIAANGLLEETPSLPAGALYKVKKSDPQHPVKLDVGLLSAPGGIAVDGKFAYISNNSILAGGGEILRVRY